MAARADGDSLWGNDRGLEAGEGRPGEPAALGGVSLKDEDLGDEGMSIAEDVALGVFNPVGGAV